MQRPRSLIYIPILHTQHDMGSLASQAKKEYVKKFGEKLYRHHVRSIDQMWTGIKMKLARLKLPPSGIYLYQDGLPVCGREKEIVDHSASLGSPNHKLLQWLMNQGAILVGTEDPELLVREYQFIQKILTAPNEDEKKRLAQDYEKEAPQLLKKRDLFISKRIEETLPLFGTSILFLGLLHRVDELLPKDIHVSYLIHHLPFQRSFEVKFAG